jgi:hypothetical protein
MMAQTWSRNWMPDNKYSPKVELCEVENIGVYKFNIFCIKSDELQLLKILSANKVAILCYVDLFYQVCYIYYCACCGDGELHVVQLWSNWSTHMNPHTCFSDKWLSAAGNQYKGHFIIQQMHKYIIYRYN